MKSARSIFLISSFLLLCPFAFSAAPASSPLLQEDSQGQANIRQELISLRAEDGRGSYGILLTPTDKTPSTAILNMHPRGDGRGYFNTPLAKAGFAVFGHANRHVLNDRDGIHEEMLLDIAAGMRFLKGRGFEKIVLLGMSGGGPLMVYYQAQASTPPPGRVSTPAGDPPNLNEFNLPPADGLLLVIPLVGQGNILQARIDPSVINEGDPLSIDPPLDMYNPANGFRMPSQVTTYSQEFIDRYREGQRKRIERLDRWARDLIAEQNHYKSLMEQPDFKDLPFERQQWIERNAATERMMTIYRTWADLRYMDLKIDPSDRIVGTNSGTTPWIDNFASRPTPDYMKPRAFLSSRSAISSHAATLKNIPKVKVPTIIIQGTAHRALYPSDTKSIFEVVGAEDKELVWIVGGDVSMNPSGPKAGKGTQRQQAIDAATSWMLERF